MPTSSSAGPPTSPHVRRLTESGVLVLVGPSGSGKSSLLRAGLAASLADDGVQCVIVSTGTSEDEADRDQGG